MKTCRKCGETLPTESFCKKSSAKDGLFPWCRRCQSEYAASRPRQKSREASKRSNAAARERNREFILRYLLENPCVDCGEGDVEVLQFDHVRGEKRKSLSWMVYQSYSINAIQAEIDKCEVRCANCHIKATNRRGERCEWKVVGG